MRRHRTRLALAASLLTLALSACGQTDDSGVATAGGEPQPSPGEGTGAQTYTECLRDQGVEVSEPDPDTGLPQLEGEVTETARAELQQAMEACNELAPEGVREPLDQADLEQYQAFAECMRNNGVPDHPDPQPGGDAGVFSGIDRTSPAYQEAMKACEQTLSGGDR